MFVTARNVAFFSEGHGHQININGSALTDNDNMARRQPEEGKIMKIKI